MNDHKFQFIICSNNEDYLEECILYLSLLEIPEGYSIDVISITEAESMAAGYNEGMKASDAKYKIYMHQDVFIIYKKFLYAVLKIFGSDERIGMIGMVGSTKLPSCGVMWYKEREGALYGLSHIQKPYAQYEYDLKDGLHEVEAVDGLLIVTNRDLPWREDIFDAWDFYDVSQCFEFRKQGFKIVVPEQLNPWCVHDDGMLNGTHYDKYRKRFLKEYGNMIHLPEESRYPENAENIKTYVVIYHENAGKKERALAEKIRSEVDTEGNAVYYIGIGETDTYEECIESFYAFRPDMIITVNGAGFTLQKENGELLYNALYCECIHVLAGIPWKYKDCLTKRMNFSSMLIVSDAVGREYIETYCENIPQVIYRPELKDYIDTEERRAIERRLDMQPEVYRKISKELVLAFQKSGQPFEKLLEKYLKEHRISVSDDEFVDLLIQMKDAAEYIQAGSTEQKQPLVSVVIPTYNREKTLRNAIESVLGQSYANLELIIADDCSTDRTETLVKSMMEKDNRIKYIRGEKNAGAGGARNLGASIAAGEYITFNDSDSVWRTDKLEKQLAVFEENPEAGLVFHAFTVIDENGEEISRPFKELPEDFNEETMLQYLLLTPLAGTPTMMIPMQVWKETGGFDEKRRTLEDYELSLRIAAKYQVCYIHDSLLTDYYSAGSVNSNWQEGIKTCFYILEEFADEYKLYDAIRQMRIFLMWDTCMEAGEEEFFKKQFRSYAEAVGENLNQLGRKMYAYVKESGQSEREWDIFGDKQECEKCQDPLVSVVIPTYNREKVLQNAMDSVLEQSYTNLELIIADDCSGDNTEILVKNMMEQDSRIKYIKAAKNMGAAAARNLGASIATGDYIAFNDSDAIWQKEKLERQLDIFKQYADEEPGMVFHAYILAGKEGEKQCLPFEKLPEDFVQGSMLGRLLEDPLVDTSAMMLPMQVWKESGGFNEHLRCLEDYELSLRIAASYNVFYFRDPLITTYYSVGSVNQNWKEGIKTYFYVLKEFAEQYKAYEMTKLTRIFLLWNICMNAGEDEFFREQFHRYTEEAGEDLKKLGQKMQRFVKEYTTVDGEWDITD